MSQALGVSQREDRAPLRVHFQKSGLAEKLLLRHDLLGILSLPFQRTHRLPLSPKLLANLERKQIDEPSCESSPFRSRLNPNSRILSASSENSASILPSFDPSSNSRPFVLPSRTLDTPVKERLPSPASLSCLRRSSVPRRPAPLAETSEPGRRTFEHEKRLPLPRIKTGAHYQRPRQTMSISSWPNPGGGKTNSISSRPTRPVTNARALSKSHEATSRKRALVPG